MPDAADRMVDMQLDIGAAFADQRAAAAIARGAALAYRPTRANCEHCGHDIGHERLAAQPFARTCIVCQTKLERGDIRGRH